MSVSRQMSRFRRENKDPAARRMRSMVSSVAIDAYTARDILYKGREAADGSVDSDSAEEYGVIGVASKPWVAAVATIVSSEK